MGKNKKSSLLWLFILGTILFQTSLTHAETWDDVTSWCTGAICIEGTTIYVNTGVINETTWTIATETGWTTPTTNIDIQITTSLGEEFDNALTWMYANGLTSYWTETWYRPYDYLTREEATKIIWQAYKVLGYAQEEKNNACTFNDENVMDTTLVTYIQDTCKRGIFKWANGKFMPKEYLTKGQTLAVLIRMLEWKVSYEWQEPRWKEYYRKGYSVWITKENTMTNFEKNITRYEIALFIYRVKNIATNDQLKISSLNTFSQITPNILPTTGTWTTDTSWSTIPNSNMDAITNPEFIEAIHWMYDNKLTKYNSVESYSPYNTITRAQVAKIIDKFSTLLNLTLSPTLTSCTFADINDLDEELKTSIKNVCEKGIMKWSNGNFLPNDLIYKSQFVAMLMRLFEGKSLDETTTPRWKNYFEKANELGIITPSDAITFENAISRYEVAMFLYKFKVKYNMLKSLNSNQIQNEIITTVPWSMNASWTQSNAYVDILTLKKDDFELGYIEVLGTRYKIVKTIVTTYFANNFARYGEIFDLENETKQGTIVFYVSNTALLWWTIRLPWSTVEIQPLTDTNAYYKIIAK